MNRERKGEVTHAQCHSHTTSRSADGTSDLWYSQRSLPSTFDISHYRIHRCTTLNQEDIQPQHHNIQTKSLITLSYLD